MSATPAATGSVLEPMHDVARGGRLSTSRGRSKMRSGKILRHWVAIDEHEVFCLIHKPVELHEVQPSRFAGRVASWAEQMRSAATATRSTPS
jgi:hypothetical protein